MPQADSLRGTMLRRLSVGVVLCALAAGRVAAVEAAPPDRPTPAQWEQWQPQSGDADSRLHRLTTVWECEAKLGDLVAELAQASSVDLTVISELRPLPVSLFVRNGTTGGVMSALQQLLDGRWESVRGQAPEQRAYRLTMADPPSFDSEEWLYEYRLRNERRLAVAGNAPLRAAREARLALLQEAAGLSEQELLRQYAETDPGLCLSLLSPKTSPMLRSVALLPAADREELLAVGEVHFPIGRLGPEVQDHLAQWLSGAWGRPSGSMTYGEVPQVFSTADARWPSSQVTFRWADEGIEIDVQIAGVGRFQDSIGFPGSNPGTARLRLIELGYLADEPGARAAAKVEAEAWEREHPDSGSRDGRRAPSSTADSPLLPGPSRVDAALRRTLLLEDSDLAVPEVLEEVSRQCGVPVVSDAGFAEDGWGHRVRALREGTTGQVELGELLDRMRTDGGGRISWLFQGRYLIVLGEDAFDEAYRRLPPERAAQFSEWLKALRPGTKVTIDQVADAVADLGRFQAARLWRMAEPYLGSAAARLPMLPVYGRMTREQRRAVREGGEVRLADLGRDTQAALWFTAKRARPWLRRQDLGGATVGGSVAVNSEGDEEFRLTLDLHFAGAPTDGTIVLTWPTDCVVRAPASQHGALARASAP
jgi:hypothetical protein